MKRKIAILFITVFAIVLISAVLVGVVLLNQQKVSVSNTRLEHYLSTNPNFPHSSTCVGFTAKNLYSTYLSTVDIYIDGTSCKSYIVNSNQANLQIPPEISEFKEVYFTDFPLSSLSAHEVKLYFHFEDGKYEIHNVNLPVQND